MVQHCLSFKFSVFLVALTIICESTVANRQQLSQSVEDYDYELPPGNYPTYKDVPQTQFSCQDKLIWNYYADQETGCQVFHICETEESKTSFLCPIGSVFNQRLLVCDWWYNVQCDGSTSFYPEKNKLVDGLPLFVQSLEHNLKPRSSEDDVTEKIPIVKVYAKSGRA